MNSMEEYSYNDWRYFLAHKEGSKYDWSTGTNPPEYNHDYWEKHKEEIMAKRRQKNGSVRTFGENGVGYKSRSEDKKSYENRDDYSNELTDDEKKNIRAHNDQVQANIDSLTKSVNDYITANKDKLTSDQIAALRKDLATQVEIAREQMISTKNSDDYEYIKSLRKQYNSPTSSNRSISKSSSTNSYSRTSRSSSNAKTSTPTKNRTRLGAEAARSVNNASQREEQRLMRNYNRR